MKTIMNSLKKAAKWYFEKTAQNYYWTPSCTVPTKYLK